MAITLPSDLTKIRPLEGAIVRRLTAGTGGVTEGAVVADGSDGVVLADGNAGNKLVKGIALKAASAGQVVPVVVFGAVGGFSGCTVGAAIYPDDTTVGLATETASTYKIAVGTAETAAIVFVNPSYIP